MAAPPDFCSSLPSDSHDDLLLHSTAQSFLQLLNLPSIHPHCTSFTKNGAQPPAPPMGPLHFWSYHDDSDEQTTDVLHKAWQSFITLFHQATPALFAMGELWLRLFACVISPLSLCYLLKKEMMASEKITEKKNVVVLDRVVCILSVASSSVLLTDSYYVHEYGRMYGGCMFILSTVLSFRCCLKEHPQPKHKFTAKMIFLVLAGLVLLTINLLLHSNGGYAPSTEEFQSYPHPGIDLPPSSTVSEGLYYSSSNPTVKSIASTWPEQSRTYSYENGATPWLPTGDSRTGIPFIVNSVAAPVYKRVWVSNADDGEAVALDVAFPLMSGGKKKEEHYHDFEKPVYLVLHGLNGGSHEEYVKDFVTRRIEEGSTVVVMIARGLMDTPLRGWNGFHGARITDVDAAAKALHSVTSRRKHNQLLAGVGYSMGAIILGNYVARSGKSCHLDTAMIVSGGLDMREQLNFYRSMRLWQPMLTAGLREDIIMGKFARHYKERLTKEQFVSLLRSTSISELDLHAVVAYNSYDDISHYYSDMSAMGDRPSPFASAKNNATSTFSAQQQQQQFWGRFADISIPTCVLHALDDPLVSWRTIVPNNDNPQDIVDSGSGNVMLLLTKDGGHVGWPLGLNPALEGWKWMNNAVRDFVHSVDKTLKKRDG